jgi:hypothetical protein
MEPPRGSIISNREYHGTFPQLPGEIAPENHNRGAVPQLRKRFAVSLANKTPENHNRGAVPLLLEDTTKTINRGAVPLLLGRCNNNHQPRSGSIIVRKIQQKPSTAERFHYC